jgi:ribosomal protein L1
MEPHTFTTTGTLSGNSSTYLTDFRISSGTTPSSHSLSISNPINFTQATSKQIMQNKVAVFKVTRDKFEAITKAEFLKELWVETKNGQSVEFQVARDKDLADYEMSDLSIRTIYSVTF